ncbi:hypothetical protein [Flavihumibacter profundi]|uniref:hypothetical protein n=1 Tax=Flavihumibacter profundi TaxID=2716883 RepID=UPI001CC4BA08|nr:hypothetical protein [Flavihumibacter profundi]MBZ5856398.1 hypothetical protein [Flavihumibacter profundi]
MGLFYKVSPKKLFEVRNEIFVKNGIPALKKSGFVESPYTGMRFGKVVAGVYAYDLCRLNSHSHLEFITTYISKGDRWINVYLNIFELKPALNSQTQLHGLSEMQFHLPPNSVTRMRLRIDDYKGMPLFRTVEYRIRSFYSEKGFQKRIEELSDLIESDLNNINSFVKHWYNIHQPIITNWEGKKIDKPE